MLPNVYFTSDTISEKEFDRFNQIEQLEAISRKTIIENTSTDTDSDVYLPGKFITPFAPKLSADANFPIV